MKTKTLTPHRKAQLTLSVFLIVTMLLSGSCKLFQNPEPTQPTPTSAPPTPIPSPTPAYTLDIVDDGSPLAPKIVDQNPPLGKVLAADGSVEITFDQPMDQERTAQAWMVVDDQGAEVTGSLSWLSPRTLHFQPAQPPSRGSTIYASLSTSATSADGVAMAEPIQMQFDTGAELQVSQVFPADRTEQAATDSVITVIFNRPVVPLVISVQQADLPNPIQIEPALEGTGQWINTSVYAFKPATRLLGGTAYQVTVSAGLADAVGGTSLTEDFSWNFTTALPYIDAYWLSDYPWDLNPTSARFHVPLEQGFGIRFGQPMDRLSVESALSLTSLNGEAVPLEITWDEASTTLAITPTVRMALGTDYILGVDASAQAYGGGSLEQGMAFAFTTVFPPAVDYTTPYDGEVQSEFNSRLSISFASPMKLDSLKGKVVVDPPLPPDTEWYYEDGGYYWASWQYSTYGLQASTRYEVTVLPGMEDIYGNQIEIPFRASFTTGPYQPSAYLQMPSDGPVLYRSGGPQDFYISYRNIQSVELVVERLSPEVFASMQNWTGDYNMWTYLPPLEDRVWEKVEQSSARLNQRVLTPITPTLKDGSPLPPGFYRLTLESPEVENYGRGYDDVRLLVVASANLTLKTTDTEALVWLTDLETGKPLANVPVKLYNQSFKVVGETKTNRDGSAYLTGLVKGGDYYDVFIAVAQDDTNFAFAISNWSAGASPYDFGVFQEYYSRPGRPVTYLYTDRPLYRPGQPVYFKGVMRIDDDGDYQLPDAKQVWVEIRNYNDELVESGYHKLSAFGSFDGQFTLDAQAALGPYTIQVKLKPDADVIGSLGFTVAEYRKPEFQVEVTGETENALPGDKLTFQIKASYFSGGAVANAEVYWSLRATPFTFTPPSEYSAYDFSDNERDSWYDYNPYASGYEEFIAEGNATTGPDGVAVVTLPADLADSKTGKQFVLEATVTDFTKTVVSGRVTVTVHKSSVYPGARAKSYVGQAGKEQIFELVGLDWEGNPLPGLPVSVEIVERRWYSVQEQDSDGRLRWTSSVEELPVAEIKSVKLDSQGKGQVTFTPENGGIFKARVTAVDPHGNVNSGSAFMWVAGEDYIPWRQNNNRALDLITDKTSYLPGDTAEILIASPFQEAVNALVTVERGHIRSYEVIQLESNSTVYRLPITGDMAPNVYVSVVIIQGAGATGAPDFRTGIHELKVEREEQNLVVEVVPDREQSTPGGRVDYTVRTTNSQGKPVSAEVSLGLSDLAALSLSDPNSQPILDYFFYERGLSVWTAVPIVYSIENYNAELAAERTAEGIGMGAGGGKGYGEEGVPRVRGNFPDTAYWNAYVLTGDKGEAKVSVTLPDNLTTWRMDARAVTQDTRVGQQQVDILSTKPLLVRPLTPRFFVVGDEVVLGAAIHNNTSADLPVSVKLEAQGLELRGDVTQQVTIPAGQQAYIAWNAAIPLDSTRVDLIFSVEGGAYEDASLPPMGTLDNQGLPVYRYEVPETVGTSGQLLKSGTMIESINLPPTWDITSGKLTIQVAPSLAASMTDALTYLKNYPYECVEQTISRFLPNVITTRVMKEAGIQDDAMAAELETQVNTALQRLYNWQHADGGWGWWSTDKSDPLTSAYAVLGLVEAQTSGYTVSEDVLDRALSYLREQLITVKQMEQPYKLNRQAFLLYVLARAGQPAVSQTVNLFAERLHMAVYAQAYLAHTLYLIDNGDSRLQTLLSDFNTQAITSASGTHWEEQTTDSWNWNTDTRSTAIVLSALSIIDPQNPLNANAVRWLMAHRTDGHWYSTQETAWVLMALGNWMTASGELQADYEYAVGFNGERIGGGFATQETLREVYEVTVDLTQLLQAESNRLAIVRGEGTGNLYYTAFLDVNLPVEQVESLDRGVLISRTYHTIDDRDTSITQAGLGDLVLVRLTVVVPYSMHYLVVNDPLPAGLEAVDQTLNTSQQDVSTQSVNWEDLWWGWGWWSFEHIEMRDESVVLSASFLPAGTYEYVYLARATTAGTFRVIPPTAQQFYFPDVYGRGDGSLFVVTP